MEDKPTLTVVPTDNPELIKQRLVTRSVGLKTIINARLDEFSGYSLMSDQRLMLSTKDAIKALVDDFCQTVERLSAVQRGEVFK